ncbi:MAG: hypothetical protein AAFW84_35005 [Cyanobacteria bacterium J06635_15]
MQFDIETFTYDEDWLRSMAQIEASCDEIGAGVDGVALGALIEHPADYSRVVAAQMLVLRVWQAWVSEWTLGVGTQSAQLKGRQLLLERLKTAESSLQKRLLSIVDEKYGQAQDEWQLTEVHQQAIRQTIESVLTPDDWNEIAKSACDRIHTQVIAHQTEALSA